METPYETQYSLETFEPNMPTAPILLAPSGAGEVKTYFIRVRPTMRWWKCNRYNLNITGLGVTVNPRDPKPSGRVQIAVYRSVLPIPPAAVGLTFAEMIPGTLYDTGSIPIITLTTPKITFPDEVLGGCFWIAIRVQDTTLSGANFMMFNSFGWTIADANIASTLLQDTTSTGNLPTSYAYTNIAYMTAEFPWVRMDLV